MNGLYEIYVAVRSSIANRKIIRSINDQDRRFYRFMQGCEPPLWGSYGKYLIRADPWPSLQMEFLCLAKGGSSSGNMHASLVGVKNEVFAFPVERRLYVVTRAHCKTLFLPLPPSFSPSLPNTPTTHQLHRAALLRTTALVGKVEAVCKHVGAFLLCPFRRANKCRLLSRHV
jgi:hypothetical protein